jgi:hypothetical protein
MTETTVARSGTTVGVGVGVPLDDGVFAEFAGSLVLDIQRNLLQKYDF